jgi:hypothetical protein
MTNCRQEPYGSNPCRFSWRGPRLWWDSEMIKLVRATFLRLNGHIPCSTDNSSEMKLLCLQDTDTVWRKRILFWRENHIARRNRSSNSWPDHMAKQLIDCIKTRACVKCKRNQKIWFDHLFVVLWQHHGTGSGRTHLGTPVFGSCLRLFVRKVWF